jgi:hypothetical protein
MLRAGLLVDLAGAILIAITCALLLPWLPLG